MTLYDPVLRYVIGEDKWLSCWQERFVKFVASRSINNCIS